MSPVVRPTIHRFPGWELRPQERLLLVEGAAAALGARAFDVLLALVERRGRVVSKNELLDAAWPGLVVEENNVSVQISALRKLLGPSVIATVASRGYRLAVVPLDGAAPAPAPVRTAAPAPEPRAADEALVGRAADLAAVRERLAAHGLVTLTGTGGIGKTSLARAVVAGAAPGHCRWVDLAPLSDPARLVPLLAQVLGAEVSGPEPGAAELVAALAHRRGCVVLDNCEHLLDAVADFLHLALPGAPGLRWLATSQAPLRLAQEQVYRLEPLAVPAEGAAPEDIRHAGAVELLRRRVCAGDRHFELSAANLPLAADLCRQLDGLPLAIEMAAALVATVGLTSVHEQLGQRLRLLTGPRHAPERHHRLHSTLDWTHGLLSAPERQLFRRLAPFVGGFTAAMARRIACDPESGPDSLEDWQVLPALSALVDKSLAHRSPDGRERFYLFESTRAFAQARLAEAGEQALVERRHAHVVADVLEPIRSDWEQLRDEEWIARYAIERPNARAALGYAIAAAEADLVAQLVAAVGMIDAFDNANPEIVALALPPGLLDQALPSHRGPALLELAIAQQGSGQRDRGTELAQLALADFNTVGDHAGAYRALAQLVRGYESRPGQQAAAQQALAQWQAIAPEVVPNRTRLWCHILAGMQYGGGRTLESLQDLEQAARQCGFQALASVCRVHLMDELLVQGQDEQVLVAAQQALQAGEPRPRVKATILHNLAQALLRLDRLAAAREAAQEALRTVARVSHLMLCTLALVAAREGRPREAAMMQGWIARAVAERNAGLDPVDAAFRDEVQARLATVLPPERLQGLMQVGAAMPPAEMMALALRVPRSDDPATGGGASGVPDPGSSRGSA